MLPNYDEAVAQSMKQPPPPYYQVAATFNQILPKADNNTQPRETIEATLHSSESSSVLPTYDEASVSQNGVYLNNGLNSTHIT